MADPETTRALGEVTTALEFMGSAIRDLSGKIEDVSVEGRAESKAVQTRLEDHAADTRNRLHDLRGDMHATITALDRNVAQIETGLANHIETDRQEFDRIERALASGETDRGSIWRILGGLGASGGLGAFVAKWFSGE